MKMVIGRRRYLRTWYCHTTQNEIKGLHIALKNVTRSTGFSEPMKLLMLEANKGIIAYLFI